MSNHILIDGKMYHLTDAQAEAIASAIRETGVDFPKKVLFPNVEDGGIFKIGKTNYIKFPDVHGKTPVVARDILFISRFGKDNDLLKSDVLDSLYKNYLPEVIAAVGKENVLKFKTDLTTLDGLHPYGDLESLVSLPTLDFYRKHVAIFDKYPVNEWWWLAAPESAAPHGKPRFTLCVSPSGFISIDGYDRDRGVRPFYILNSSIFGSCEA